MTTTEKVNALLAGLETRHGIKVTQAALARAYGCGPSPMHQFLTGKKKIPDLPRLLAAISECLPAGWSVHFRHVMTAEGGEVKDNLMFIDALPPEPEGEGEEEE